MMVKFALVLMSKLFRLLEYARPVTVMSSGKGKNQEGKTILCKNTSCPVESALGMDPNKAVHAHYVDWYDTCGTAMPMIHRSLLIRLKQEGSSHEMER